MKSEGGLGWSEGEVGMYDVKVCVAAKVRMIPIPAIPILYCHRGRG